VAVAVLLQQGRYTDLGVPTEAAEAIMVAVLGVPIVYNGVLYAITVVNGGQSWEWLVIQRRLFGWSGRSANLVVTVLLLLVVVNVAASAVFGLHWETNGTISVVVVFGALEFSSVPMVRWGCSWCVALARRLGVWWPNPTACELPSAQPSPLTPLCRFLPHQTHRSGLCFRRGSFPRQCTRYASWGRLPLSRAPTLLFFFGPIRPLAQASLPMLCGMRVVCAPVGPPPPQVDLVCN
jgi:hypothetical protein